MRILSVASLGFLACSAVPAAFSDDPPVAGARGIGDPYYPDLGNGGYDTLHYELVLAVDPVANHLDAVATIDAMAEVSLASFHLDLAGLEVEAILVDGAPAAFQRDGHELMIEPERALAGGSRFQVVVRYSGSPQTVPVPGIPVDGVGWMHFEDRVFTLSQPSGSMTWYPVNNHPRDKATYEFRVTVPETYVVAANGILVSNEEREDGRRTFHFRASDPMASYLATMNVAPFEVREMEGPGGLPLTFYAPIDAREGALDDFDRTPELLEVLTEWFGPYPFESCGGVIMNESFGAALETQTIPVYGGREAGIGTQVHELAHQWFGNSVSVDSWRDLWLSESFASYAGWLWREREDGSEELDARLRRQYEFLCRRGDQAPADPGAERLFGLGVYLRGPMALHALRLRIGDEPFFEVLRTFAARYRNATATTADFTSLAEEISGADLGELFEGWLYGSEIPDLPEAELSCAESDEGNG